MTKSQRVEKNQSQSMPAEHRGMPAKDAQPQEALVGKQTTQRDASSEASLRLPHERDQSEEMTNAKPDPIIKQAFADKNNGLKDTSQQPEMGKAYQKQKADGSKGT